MVDDNATNRQVAVHQLRHLGYQADSASRGLDALTRLETEQYDMILMDCEMPEMDGFETTRRLRQMKAPNRATPVVAMTAHALRKERDKCIAAGMNDYLAKPVQLDQLRVMVERWIAADGCHEAVAPSAMRVEPASEDIHDNIQRFRSDMGKEDADRILMTVLRDTTEAMAILGDAVETSNIADIRRSVHRLKGTLGLVASAALMTQCDRLQSLDDIKVLEAALPIRERGTLDLAAIAALMDTEA